MFLACGVNVPGDPAMTFHGESKTKNTYVSVT